MLELQEKLELLQKKLNGALLAADGWDPESLMTVIPGIESKPDAVAFLGNVYNSLKQSWEDAHFPGSPHQQIVETGDFLVVVRDYGAEIHLGMMIDKSKAPLGLVFAHLGSVFGAKK